MGKLDSPDFREGEALPIGRPTFSEADRLRAGVGEEAMRNLDIEKKGAFHDFLELVGMMEGVIPPEFLKVFLMAQNLERHMGRGLAGILGLSKREESVPSADQPKVPIDRRSYRVAPVKRRARGPEDLALLEPEELLLQPLVETVRRAVCGELEVWDLGPEPEGKGSKILPIPQADKGELLRNEQDLYLLLDLSYSMGQNNRLILAQTLCLWYLQQKYIKQGARPRLHMRGYAIDVGELVQAEKLSDLPQVVNEILAADARQKGTDTDMALLQVAKDIDYNCLSGAEVLLVTDGLCALDLEKIKAAMPDGTKIHTVKIGRDVLLPTESQIRDLVPGLMGSGEAMDRATKVLNDRVRSQWALLSETVIVLDDISEIKLEADFITKIKETLEGGVFDVDFNEASALVKRQAVFLNDLLVHILNGKNMVVEGALLAEAKSLHQRLLQWLSPGVSIEVEAKIERGEGKAVPTSLKLGHHKVGVGLRLFKKSGGGIKVAVNTFKILMQLMVALVKKVAGRG